MNVTIYWTTKNQETRRRIRQKFNIPRHTTVNGETSCSISDEQYPLLQEVERRGFIQIRFVSIHTPTWGVTKQKYEN